MAKWGEGDPRWIVEERADGTNAGNWHWTEKNATEWSKQRLTALLTNLRVEDVGVGHAVVTEVTSITGEASANNRKCKLIFFYELVIKLKWTGETATGAAVNGTIEIPNLSEENSIDEVEVDVALTSTETPENRKVKDLLRKRGATEVRQQLKKWLTELKEEYSKDIIKPMGEKIPQAIASSSVPLPVSAAVGAATSKTPAAGASSAVPAHSSAGSGHVRFKTLDLTDTFSCTPQDLFGALVDETKVRAYTQSDCKIDPKVGGKFSTFSGNVQGVFKELVPYERIVQAWRFKHWPENHYSEVRIEITNLGDHCRLTLHQSEIPEADYERTRAGWRELQWDRMKAILGFGSGLGSFNF